jgi:hypothetical protein
VAATEAARPGSAAGSFLQSGFSIVNRKAGGNRTQNGAETQAVTSADLRTCKNKAIDAFAFVSNAFCGVFDNLSPSNPS